MNFSTTNSFSSWRQRQNEQKLRKVVFCLVFGSKPPLLLTHSSIIELHNPKNNQTTRSTMAAVKEIRINEELKCLVGSEGNGPVVIAIGVPAGDSAIDNQVEMKEIAARRRK